jgi:predicted DCC family thiol-disulfide oxidoreductase YuxK
MIVADPPTKPLLIWDGDCHFCARWIERWKEETGDRVDYITSQEIGNRFPEIPRELFSRTVVLVEAGGRVFVEAEAVCRSLGENGRKRWPQWAYYHLPGFAGFVNIGYRLIARNRALASRVTRLFWGRDVRVPTYSIACRWFLRTLGAIYLIAFISMWVQVDGLIGANGILPVQQFLPAASKQLGAQAPFVLPTLCWLNSSNSFLHFLCAGGAIASLFLIIGFVPILCLIVLFVFYLSLTIAGQTFFSFQWDILLLETGFLALFFAPARWWMRAGNATSPSRVSLFLLKLLLFKLMFMSGVVKLTSGDPSWLKLSALDYHYWTQPLPTFLGWWAAQSSEWLRQFSTAVTLIVEIIVPFFIWAPRRLRFGAFVLLVTLQVMIALTGNYCFFNLLTIALCLLLLDDQMMQRRASTPALHESRKRATVMHGRYRDLVPTFILIVTLPVNAMLIYSAFKPDATWPRPIAAIGARLDYFRVVNGYGLFRVMTKSRPEILVEGSDDGIHWKPYVFKWKPGPLDRAPGFVEPHQPRLDWQMWFAALSDYRQNPWFIRFMEQLLRGSPDVRHLLAENPFPQAPRYVRATLYAYRFTTQAERARTGHWWKRERLRDYFPEVSLQAWRR